MAITWTIIVVGALLHGIQCNADNSPATISTTNPGTITIDSNKPTKPVTTFSVSTPTNSLMNTTIATASTASLESTKPATTRSSITLATQPIVETTSTAQTAQSSPSAHQESTTNPPSTTQTTTIQPTTPSASTAPTTSNDSSKNSPTVASDASQATTKLIKATTAITTEGSTTQLSSTPTSAVDKYSTSSFTSAPGSKSKDSQIFETTEVQTTTAPITSDPPQHPRSDAYTSTTQKPDSFDLNNSDEEWIRHEACEMLHKKIKGNCTVTFGVQGKKLTVTITMDADHDMNNGVTGNNTSQKHDANEDTIPDTLIAILASCGALVLILCCFAAYCTYHRRSYRKNQQHLTEELQTVENGYHDNPTLEVMEVQPEMQEKKPTLNGEFNDSWIVPIDNLLKEDIPDEEDTHL